MNENTINEAAGYVTIGARRVRTTKTGRTMTDFDPSVLPCVKRYRIDAGRSYTSKGVWATNYQVFVKLENGDDHAWRSSANVATQYGMSMPLAYGTYEKAVAAARKMKETWGKAVEKKAPKAKDPTKAELAAQNAELAAKLAALEAKLAA